MTRCTYTKTEERAMSKYQDVFDYANPYESDAYAMDAGHGWDRLAAIAGEYHRGEISWEQAKTWCDDNRRDMEDTYAAEFPTCETCGEPIDYCLGHGVI